MNLLVLAVAPVFIAAFYIYIRDKYEKEPWGLLLTGLFFGIFITVPIVRFELVMTAIMPEGGRIFEAFYLSFAVASFVEELMKFIVLFALIWLNRNFNEPFDGIVYSVFVSLGFALFENILYVFNEELGGLDTALLRAVFSVPAHGLFGVMMGFYLAKGKFYLSGQLTKGQSRFYSVFMAFFLPFILHGIYDFILLASIPLFPFFMLFLLYLWINSFKKIKAHSLASPFRRRKPYEQKT